MPIAKPDQARTLRDVPVVIAVLGNDEGGNLSVSGYTLPPAGACCSIPTRASPTPRQRGSTAPTASLTPFAINSAGPPTARSPSCGPTEFDADGDERHRQCGDRRRCRCARTGQRQRSRGRSACHHRRRCPRTRHDFGPARPVDPLHAAAGFDGIDSFTYTVGDGVVGDQPRERNGGRDRAECLRRRGPIRRRRSKARRSPSTPGQRQRPRRWPNQLDRHEPSRPWRLDAESDLRLLHARGRLRRRLKLHYSIRDDQGGQQHRDRDRGSGAPEFAPVAQCGQRGLHRPTVVVDPLANDSDPDGDALRLTALTLPVKGQIALNPTASSPTRRPPASPARTASPIRSATARP